VRAGWERDFMVGTRRTRMKLTHELLDGERRTEARVSGGLLEIGDLVDVNGEVVVGRERTVLLSAVGSGTTFMTTLASDGVREVGMYTRAGVVNIHASAAPNDWVRLKLGRGSGSWRCPFTTMLEWTDGETRPRVELGMKRRLGSGRKLLARIIPASSAARAPPPTAWVEYTDSKAERGATWVARMVVPLDDDWTRLQAAQLSLRRKWCW